MEIKNQKVLIRDQNTPHNHPARFSRNYSGSSAYYTPPFLIRCLLRGVNYCLIHHFKNFNVEGLFSSRIEFLDPAAGELSFPIELVKLCQEQVKPVNFNKWFTQVFLNQSYSFEIDSKTISNANTCFNSAMKEIEKKSCVFIDKKIRLKHLYQRNPLNGLDKSKINDELPPLQKDNILIIYGNPPYAISSESKGLWISRLVEDYKKDLQRKGKKRIVGLKGIQDDYVKFIRYCQWLISDRNQPGIIALVLNNYFLDGDIFRGLRSSLLKSFDFIYIINLFGDPKKSNPPSIEAVDKPSFSDKEKDENIFGIQTGICLFIAVYLSKYERDCKTLNEKQEISEENIANVFYCGCYGSIKRKKVFCNKNFESLPFVKIPYRRDFNLVAIPSELIKREEEYNQFYCITEIFSKNIIGIQSLHDTLITHPDRFELEKIITSFYDGTYDKIIIKDSKNQNWVKADGVIYHDARDWKIADGKAGSLKKALQNIQKWQWRGFDRWWVCYDEHLMTKGSSSYRLMQYMYPWQNNLAIIVSRKSRKASGDTSVFATNIIAESHCVEGGSGIGDYIFPLRISSKSIKKGDWNHPISANEINFSSEFLSLFPSNYYKSTEEIFYYIYAILWTPKYRLKYQFMLKQDFPRIPFPKNAKIFHLMAEIGEKLLKLHTLQFNLNSSTFYSSSSSSLPSSSSLSSFIFPSSCPFKINLKAKPIVRHPGWKEEENRIYFDLLAPNTSFWIDGISKEMWEFEIGGKAQLSLFLKNRIVPSDKKKGIKSKTKRYQFSRALNSCEISYFLKICVSIQKTVRLQEDLDRIYSYFGEILKFEYTKDNKDKTEF
ncbi:MAG: hypothetical protein K9W44_13970 [Candidatus Lokiarchaeota archaeon]|nr:hypothetical protein [Candidatus Harpocratesius repetitus]